MDYWYHTYKKCGAAPPHLSKKSKETTGESAKYEKYKYFGPPLFPQIFTPPRKIIRRLSYTRGKGEMGGRGVRSHLL
jgi:hypothetical protein